MILKNMLKIIIQILNLKKKIKQYKYCTPFTQKNPYYIVKSLNLTIQIRQA